VRFLAFPLAVYRCGVSIVHRQRHGLMMVSLNFFDFCADNRQSFLLIPLYSFEFVALLAEKVYQVREEFVRLPRRWRRRRRRNVLRLERKRKQPCCVQSGCGRDTSRSVKDSAVFFRIHRFHNRNRSTLKDLDHRTWCLRSGGMTRGGSSPSSSHCFEGMSGKC